MMWSRADETDTVLSGGCYSTVDESCSADCIAQSPINFPVDQIDVAIKTNKSLHYFCCCKSTRCNQLYALPEVNQSLPDWKGSIFNYSDSKLKWVLMLLVIGLLFLIEIIVGVVLRRKQRIRKRNDKLEIPLLKHTPQDTKNSYFVKRMPCARLENLIYRSAHTKVYKANVVKTGIPVVVKVYNHVDLAGWKRECKILYYGIQHSNIMNCMGTGLSKTSVKLFSGLLVPDKSLYTFKDKKSSFHFLLMTDYLPLGSLDKYLQEHTVTVHEALVFVTGICAGLAYLHKIDNGKKAVIVHRDLKASNILVKNDGTCCISDFGLAIDLLSDIYNERITQVGTVRYMAPEILEGCIIYRRDILPMMDVYSFGLLVWEILTRCHECPGLKTLTKIVIRSSKGPIVRNWE
ncbi:Activin receptor type-2A [Thelohanellus kitauei]|uniref:receptor protein serine/threonine kinase n=1 Tax=Thelohanellus kitauei TaxID=669202 RepID=A0A0C2MH32_THEKT|nr:Activin receptor type-2A [Thelohanellus kitauei]